MVGALHIEVLDPRYDPGLGPAEDAGAPVGIDVETSEWRPRTPPAGPRGALAFVDGAQRIEAWLRQTAGGAPNPVAGVAAAVAAGAVLAPPGARPTIAAVVVERLAIALGDDVIALPPEGGLGWRPLVAPREGPDPVARAIGQRRAELEQAVAESVAAPDRLVVLDGRRAFVRDAPGPIMGAVKTHQRTYLSGPEAAVMAALAVGQRTPLFAIGEDRLSWYQRLPVARPEGWRGILRGELPRSLGLAEAVRLADRAARELPGVAGLPHRDPRAPQNLTPIAALETHLRHRLGDQRLVLRALRRAARRASLDAAAGLGAAA